MSIFPPMRWTVLLGAGLAAAGACRHREAMPGLPVRPEKPPPEGVQVPPPGQPPVAPSPVPATTYRLLVTARAADQVVRVRFKPCQPGEEPPTCGAAVERRYQVGEGPVAVVATADGRSFDVTFAHGIRTRYDVASGARIASGDSLARPKGALALGDSGAFPVSGCGPTWAEPSADGALIFVACSRSGEIAAVNPESRTLVKRWSTPPDPHALATTPNGRLLVATHRGPGALSVWLLPADTLVAEMPGGRGAASGVAVSPDSRYAFFGLEGTDDAAGALDVVDLKELRKVAEVEVGRGVGGVTVLSSR